MTTGEQLRAKLEEASEKKDHRITNNVSRETFYFVRDNPGLTRDQIAPQLIAKGFKASSISSLLGQMIRGRLIMEDESGKLTAVIREYVPIQAAQTKRIAGKYTQRVKPKDWPAPEPKKKIVLVKRPDPAPAPQEAAQPEWSPASVIDSLNVRQAMAVYDELRKIFGE